MNKIIIDDKYLKCEYGGCEPSVDKWLKEAKATFLDTDCGMFLTHNGIVRATSRLEVRDGMTNVGRVSGMNLSVNVDKLVNLANKIKNFDGVKYLRIWINEGILNTGDSMMLIILGTVTRKQAVNAFNSLMDNLKTECLIEDERFI